MDADSNDPLAENTASIPPSTATTNSEVDLQNGDTENSQLEISSIEGKSKEATDAPNNTTNEKIDETTQSGNDTMGIQKRRVTEQTGPKSIESISLIDIRDALQSTNSIMLSYLARCCTFVIQCNECENMFRSMSSFVMHKQYFCTSSLSDGTHEPFDVESLKLKTGLRREELASRDGPWCEPCKKSFKNAEMKSRHDMYFHCKNTESPKPAESPKPITDLRQKITSVKGGSKRASPAKTAAVASCGKCGAKFATSWEMKIHVHNQCGASPRSSLSPSKTAAAAAATPAPASNSQQRYKCNLCSLDFKSAANRERHELKFHGVDRAGGGASSSALDESASLDGTDAPSINSSTAAAAALTGSENTRDSPLEAEPSTPHAPRPAKRPRSEVEDQENHFPDSHVAEAAPEDSNAPAKRFNQADQSSNGDVPVERKTASVTLFYDTNTSQCLICLDRFPSNNACEQHVKKTHADQLFDSAESAAEKQHADAADVPEVAPVVPESLMCSMCGRAFPSLAEYEEHMALPHRISIRSS